MIENLHDPRVEPLLERVLSETSLDEDLLAVGPTATIVEAVVTVLDERDGDRPRVKLLASEQVLGDVLTDFVVASTAADLVEAGELAVRTGGRLSENPLLVNPDVVMALVRGDETVAGVTAEVVSFVSDAVKTYTHRWDQATAFEITTPPLSRVRERLASDVGEAVRADFDAGLDALSSADADFDEVTLSLLVAAKHGVLFYDISKWGEDVGVASKATYSREKNRLEDAGLIETTAVPVDVGRPRQRLRFADDRLDGPEGPAFVALAREMLADGGR